MVVKKTVLEVQVRGVKKKKVPSKKAPSEKASRAEDKARLIGGRDFWLIPMKVPEEGLTEEGVKSKVKLRLDQEQFFTNFAEIPVKERTAIFQVHKRNGARFATEVARTGVFKSAREGSKETLYYKSTATRKSRIEVRLPG